MNTKSSASAQNIDTELQWRNHQPFSDLYDDVYFSSDSGLDESRYVFLAQNQLKMRWTVLNEDIFTIAETGFGTGLNFLCAWELWEEIAPPNAKLHFLSFEKHPISLTDLKIALALWPELAVLSQHLFEQYRWITPGFHRLVFAEGRITLTLVIGDVLDTIPLVKAKVDAWFLDGFSPAKNPDMWHPVLFKHMARLSAQSSTFATFTSAGVVKRELIAAGFTVNKIKGYGRKREMLSGSLQSDPCITSTNIGINKTKGMTKHAIVIGAGIAGTASAHALAVRGWQVTLIERHSAIAQEASGNPIGIIYPRLTGQDTSMHKLALSGYLHTLRLLNELKLSFQDFGACGVLQLAFDAQELKRCEDITNRNLANDIVSYVSAVEASKIAGTTLKHSGLIFPAAGWINPVAFCEALIRSKHIHTIRGCEVNNIEQIRDGWQVWGTDKKGIKVFAEAPVLILANANQAQKFGLTSHLTMQSVRGQISLLPETSKARSIKTVICTDGYISPPIRGQQALGATFSPDDSALDIRDTDHHANLSILKRMAPEVYETIGSDTESILGRASLRAATIDYLPMVGPVLDHKSLTANPPKHLIDPIVLPWLPGLYANLGHGSKGLTHASICAEMIVSSICGEPAPVDSKLLAALDPNRFLLRKLGLKALVKGLAIYPAVH